MWVPRVELGSLYLHGKHFTKGAKSPDPGKGIHSKLVSIFTLGEFLELQVSVSDLNSAGVGVFTPGAWASIPVGACCASFLSSACTRLEGSGEAQQICLCSSSVSTGASNFSGSFVSVPLLGAQGFSRNPKVSPISSIGQPV